MTTDRPYRKRLPLEVVIAELQKCKGTQFDADLVDVVVSSVGVRRLIAGPITDLERNLLQLDRVVLVGQRVLSGKFPGSKPRVRLGS